MHRTWIWLLASSLILPGTALAAADPPSTAPIPSEHRLSPGEIETILDAAARKRELAEQQATGTSLPIHGEIGFSIGTGGYRSAFGTAIVPLPDDGVAIFSFETDKFSPVRNVNLRER